MSDLAEICMTYGSDTLIKRLRLEAHTAVLRCESLLNCKVPKESSDLVEELRLQEDLAISDGNHLMSRCRTTKHSSALCGSKQFHYFFLTPRSDQSVHRAAFVGM